MDKEHVGCNGIDWCETDRATVACNVIDWSEMEK